MYKITRGAIKKYYETYDQFNKYWSHHARYNRWGVDVIGYELATVRPNIWIEIRRANAL